ncbi:hypothetical protein ACP70R_032425 [Stipagrostis hirtigluma subsp. patula]
MSSTTTAAAANLGGMWLGELASAVQGRWQAMADTAGRGEQRPRQQQLKVAVEAGRKAAKGEVAAAEDVERCGGAMSDATVCLLLDRFAPS